MRSPTLSLMMAFVFLKSDGWRFETRLARDVWRNLKELMNRISQLTETISPFFLQWSVFVDFYLPGKRNIFLLCWRNAAQSTFESGKLFNKKMWSYPWRLWSMTGRTIGFRHWRLQELWAAPRYFPVKWKWSLILTNFPDKSSSHNCSLQTWQFSALSNPSFSCFDNLRSLWIVVNLMCYSFKFGNKNFCNIFFIRLFCINDRIK